MVALWLNSNKFGFYLFTTCLVQLKYREIVGEHCCPPTLQRIPPLSLGFGCRSKPETWRYFWKIANWNFRCCCKRGRILTSHLTSSWTSFATPGFVELRWREVAEEWQRSAWQMSGHGVLGVGCFNLDFFVALPTTTKPAHYTFAHSQVCCS